MRKVRAIGELMILLQPIFMIGVFVISSISPELKKVIKWGIISLLAIVPIGAILIQERSLPSKFLLGTLASMTAILTISAGIFILFSIRDGNVELFEKGLFILAETLFLGLFVWTAPNPSK